MKKLFLLIAMLCQCAVIFAQNRISGRIVDSDGLPVIGAGLAVDGTAEGTFTDVDGKWSLDVQKGASVTVSCLGFASRTFTVGDAAVYDFTLEPDTDFLDEVVVVGYDVQKKVNLTGAVAAIPSEMVSERPVATAASALQGLAPGVTVTNRSGNPGSSGSNIRIRGIGTFGGSSASPLVLVDGVQGSLDDVDPSQIDRISVLKDAASAAIYGSRAANGVILITTKDRKSVV